MVSILKAQERWAARFASAVLTVEDRLRDVLSERGVPTPVVHTRLRAPRSSMKAQDTIDAAAKASPLYAKYGTRLEKESAAEQLAARVEQAPPAEQPKPATRKKQASTGDALTDFLGSRQGKALQREVVRGAFSLLRKRL